MKADYSLRISDLDKSQWQDFGKLVNTRMALYARKKRSVVTRDDTLTFTKYRWHTRDWRDDVDNVVPWKMMLRRKSRKYNLAQLQRYYSERSLDT